MWLEGSCRCGGVHFSCATRTPYPFMRCYCSLCRKTNGGGGYAVAIMADAASLRVEGDEHIGIFRAEIDGKETPGGRRFCRQCGCHLWNHDPRWPDAIYPSASAIDTALPVPPETVHIMLDFKAEWVTVPDGPTDHHFARYPDESIEDWHKRHRLTEPQTEGDPA